MRIVVFGANGPTGRLLTGQALAAGHEVTAVTRRPEVFPSAGGGDAVLSALGVPYNRHPITTYSAGTANIVAAMREHGIRRLAVVSSSAVEPVPYRDAGFLFNRVLQQFMTSVVGRTLYDDMRRMETLVRESDLDWTIVRPSGLYELASVTDYTGRSRRTQPAGERWPTPSTNAPAATRGPTSGRTPLAPGRGSSARRSRRTAGSGRPRRWSRSVRPS